MLYLDQSFKVKPIYGTEIKELPATNFQKKLFNIKQATQKIDLETQSRFVQQQSLTQQLEQNKYVLFSFQQIQYKIQQFVFKRQKGCFTNSYSLSDKLGTQIFCAQKRFSFLQQNVIFRKGLKLEAQMQIISNLFILQKAYSQQQLLRIQIIHNSCKPKDINLILPLNTPRTKRQTENLLEFLKSRKPVWNNKKKQFILDFKGKAKIPSVKNIILENSMGECKMLFAKSSQKQFHLQFEYPITALTAFAVAIASCQYSH